MVLTNDVLKLFKKTQSTLPLLFKEINLPLSEDHSIQKKKITLTDSTLIIKEMRYIFSNVNNKLESQNYLNFYEFEDSITYKDHNFSLFSQLQTANVII